jgi:hypothetical protein
MKKMTLFLHDGRGSIVRGWIYIIPAPSGNGSRSIL